MALTINKGKKFSKKIKIFALIIGVLIVARFALPYVVLHFANKSLANLKSLYGHIEDIDIALLRGAYKINNMYINKKDSVTGNQTQFIQSEILDLSLDWSALFKGRIVGELVLECPTLIFTKDKTEPKDIQKDSSDLKTVFEGIMPLKLNRLEIKEGVVKYVDETSKPPVEIQMNNTYVLAQNLSSVVDSTLLPSTVDATSDLYGGTLHFKMKLNALREQPTFDINAELKNLKLPELNEFFQAYANFDVNKGTLGLYTEIAAKEGKYIGYVKPIIKELDVVGREDRKDSFWQKSWESIVSMVGVILRNPEKKQVATKLPLSGTFDKANSDTWYAIFFLIRNAFIEALHSSIDNEININSVDKSK